MMKRVLALLLLLCLATSANATFLTIDDMSTGTYELMEGSTVTIAVTSEDAMSWLGYIIIPDGQVGTLSNPTIYDAAGNLSSATFYSEEGWGTGYELVAAYSSIGTPVIGPGQQFSFDFTGGTAGQSTEILLFMDPEYSTAFDSISISIVPEPVTIALLGFGVVFLRKRK